jgi:hypothetical protein
MCEDLNSMSPRERGDYTAREQITFDKRVFVEDSRQRVLPLDRIVDNYIETHVDDWAARRRDAQDGLGPWPLPIGHIVFDNGR